MATLSLTIGPVTATREIVTATALTSINNYLAAYGGPMNGTNQQKVDWYFDHLIAHTREVSRGHKRRTAEQAASETVEEPTW
jgi:hypothetical protein